MAGWLLTAWSPRLAAQSAEQWLFSGQLAESDLATCELQVQGTVRSDEGADVQLHCPDRQPRLGNLQVSLPGTALQQRRVLLIAEIKADTPTAVTLWLKSMAHGRTLLFEDDSEQALLGTAVDQEGWRVSRLTLPLDGAVTELRLGLLLQGPAQVALRNVRLVVGAVGPTAPDAAAYLDAAIALLRAELPERSDLHWNVLEPQLRVLAAGAQSTAEVYPAIRYALAQFGGRDDLLLTPSLVQALYGAPSPQYPADRWQLADGARLILKAPQPTPTVVSLRGSDASVSVN